MAVPKFISLIAGKLKEVLSIATSAGAGDADKIICTNASGDLDVTFLPPGIGPEQVTVTAGENVSQYDLANIYDDGGTLKGRKADGGTNKYVCHGFFTAAGTTGNTVVVQTNGWITGAGLTIGADYFLSATPGAYCLAASVPSGAGKIVQKIGYAVSTTEMEFEPEQEIELAS